MRKLVLVLPALLPLLTMLPGCAGRSPYATVDDLDLDSVVLYRNGIGYFEREGDVDGDTLKIKVRKDQVNDLLKSLTVVDKEGKALSVSMPLDPQSWVNAALRLLEPGAGSLAQVIDKLRGTEVTLVTRQGRVSGRISMVEEVYNEPDPEFAKQAAGSSQLLPPATRDFKITLLDGARFHVVRLSQVKHMALRDGDVAMQFQRSLDASAGEGMFEQVEVSIGLGGGRKHDLRVSYVVQAPMWKPTYRVVLPESGKGKALLQAWAVVDNTSGEDWSKVTLSLTSGAPIAFRYDLHTPRDVPRSDMTEAGVSRQARVSMGETTYEAPPPPPAAPPSGAYAPEAEKAEYYDYGDDLDEAGALYGSGSGGGGRGASAGPGRSSASKSSKPAPAPKSKKAMDRAEEANRYAGEAMAKDNAPMLDMEALQRSTQANARSKQVSGLTRIDLEDRVTVPNGSSTMVAIVNAQVDAEETFLFKPGGSGYGFETNPYRVVRFRNSTKYVLEPGPISIYSGGSFVGEGLSEAVGADTSVTIPFAVEPTIAVTSSSSWGGEELRLTRLVRGVMEVESFSQTITTYEVRGQGTLAASGFSVLVRHTRAGSNYTLVGRPAGTEDLDGAYLIPVPVAAGKGDGTVKVVEQTPSYTTLTIWDGRAPELLQKLLEVPNLDATARAKLQPIVDARREIGRIDTEIDGLERQQVELDQRAAETRANLEAIKKDPRAGDLRTKLSARLDEFTRDADKLGRKIVELNSKRLEKRIELEDMLQTIDFRAPAKPEPKPDATPASKAAPAGVGGAAPGGAMTP